MLFSYDLKKKVQNCLSCTEAEALEDPFLRLFPLHPPLQQICVEVVRCSPSWDVVGAVWPTFLSVFSVSLQHFCEQMGSLCFLECYSSRVWTLLQE